MSAAAVTAPKVREWKTFAFEGCTVKAAADGSDTGEFSGYASTWAKDLTGDQIAPGAFAQSITVKKGKIPIFFNHDSDQWIGFSTALAEDHKGLMLNGQLALKTSMGADAYQLLQAAQAIDFRVGMSIGFMTEEFEWDGDSRILTTIDLWETSLTPFPANQRAFVGDVKSSLRDFEKRLRDVGGFSVNDAKRIVSLASGDPDAHRLAPVRDVREGRSTLHAMANARRLEGIKTLWPQCR